MTDWEFLIKHPDYSIELKGMEIFVRDGVFTPDSSITNSSLILLNNMPEVKNKVVLDVGCGTGVIGLYSALEGTEKVMSVDVDEIALENTRENFRRKNLEPKVEILKSDLFENVSGRFDYIFANLPILDEVWDLQNKSTTNIVRKFISSCAEYINEGGNVYFTWASFSDVEPIREYCSKLDLKVKEISELRLGYTWYLFEISF